jgi:hypothetical protein
MGAELISGSRKAPSTLVEQVQHTTTKCVKPIPEYGATQYSEGHAASEYMVHQV